MSGHSRPKRVAGQQPAGNRWRSNGPAGNVWRSNGPAGNGWRSKGQRALMDFIPSPLYYIDRFQMLSFLLSEGDDG